MKIMNTTMGDIKRSLKDLSSYELRGFNSALTDGMFKECSTKELTALYDMIANEVNRRVNLHVARLKREHPEWIDTFYLDVEAMDPSDIKFDALEEYENAR